METKIGKLTNVEEKKTQNGASYWLVYFDNKLKYSIFDYEIINGFSLGQTLEYDLDTSGKFAKLMAVREVKVSSPLPSKPSNSNEFHLTSEAVRIGALDAAIKITKKLQTEDYEADLFSNFKMFENWILTGQKDEN